MRFFVMAAEQPQTVSGARFPGKRCTHQADLAAFGRMSLAGLTGNRIRDALKPLTLRRHSRLR
jgi:hypothetical protein